MSREAAVAMVTGMLCNISASSQRCWAEGGWWVGGLRHVCHLRRDVVRSECARERWLLLFRLHFQKVVSPSSPVIRATCFVNDIPVSIPSSSSSYECCSSTQASPPPGRDGYHVQLCGRLLVRAFLQSISQLIELISITKSFLLSPPPHIHAGEEDSAPFSL